MPDQRPPVSFVSQNIPTALTELIFRLKIKDVMSSDLVTAAKTETLRTIQHRMKEASITGVPIVEDKRLLGIVSMHDILTAFDEGTIDEAAELHMTRNIKVLEDDMPLSFAISYFNKYQYGRFPVLNKNRELCGIITIRDINTTLLREVNRIVEELEGELKQDSSEDADKGVASLQHYVVRHDFENAGRASADIKRILKKHGFDPQTIRRAAVASYELEMNLVVHSHGGRLSFRLDPEKIEIRTVDTGPGIPDVDKALEVGFSTANEWIRSLGFGAGMGLPNVKRVVDDFSLKSVMGKGTDATAIIKRP
ncbi:CBS domain-containing protein [Marispirochaeta aestuarii]|uniref:CBS domain-containing protein n=1 Tax=Marispirochaeta aestuarii TaxID=1963862 RepID=UPI002ABD73E1|nr:CBS domain-containing protein [Marispirochaeta aestuarii]